MAWALGAGDLEPWMEAPVDELLEAHSLPVRLPLTQSGVPLPRFGVLAVEMCSCALRDGSPAAGVAAAAGDASPPPGQEPHTFAVDSVLFAGGPVWALDWCPLPRGGAAPGPPQVVETLALTTHPKDQRRNLAGSQHSGPGAVQLWGVPRSAEAELLPGGLPALLALLWHQGRLAWDVQWCPDPAAFITVAANAAPAGTGNSGAVPLQGMLAAVLGSGDVVVWAVPTTRCLLDVAAKAWGPMQAPQRGGSTEPDQQQQQLLQQHQGDAGGALSLRMAPAMQLPCLAVGGSLASCCSWLPQPPHDQLLVGYWDGAVAIWQLSTTRGGAPSPILMLRADPSPITSVTWQPSRRWWLTGGCTAPEAAALLAAHRRQPPAAADGPAAAAASAPDGGRYFLTASHIGNLKVWDSADVLAPCHERLLSRHSINGAVWLGPPHVLVAAGADGIVRQVWLDAGVQALDPSTYTADVSGSCGCVWSLSACEPCAVVAYVSDGGLLGLMPLEPQTGELRHRKSHAALSGVAVAQGELWLLSAREVPGNGGLYANARLGDGGGAKKQRGGSEVPAPAVVLDPLPHPHQVLYAVRFSPNYDGTAALAYGGGAGVVRLHWISAEVQAMGR